MTTLGLVIAAAALALGAAMWTRLPASVLGIVAGIALQGLAAPVDGGLVRDGLVIAASFLVFIVGAEIERRPLRPYQPLALGLAAVTVLVTAAVGALLWLVLALNAWTAIYWVVALSASSTLLVFDLLRRRELLFESTGRIASAVALMQDLMVVLALALFAALAPGNREPTWVVAGVVGLALAGWLISRWVAPFLMQRVQLDEEERLLFILLVLFAFGAAARWSGDALVTGAYFAGLAVSPFPVGDLARGYLKSFSDFFTTIFYVLLGLLVTLPEPNAVLTELVFVTALLLVRPVILLPLVRQSGLTVRASIEVLTLLAQAGELAVLVAIVGLELGHIVDATFSAVVAGVAVTSAIAPWLSSEPVTWWRTRWYPFARKATLETSPSGHILLLGCGETGATVLEGLQKLQVELLVVDVDPAVVDWVAKRGVSVLRGDGADPAVLREANASQAKAIISAMHRPRDNARLLQHVQGPPVVVRTFSEQEAERIRELGGQPVVEAELAAAALIAWHGTARARGEGE